VKLDKIARQIRRDIAASPKKAAVLGLMVLVALYFWAPMIWGWIKPADSGGSPVAATDVILDDEPIDPVKSTKREGRTFSWEKVRRKVAADPRMTPARYEVTWNDPFCPSEPTETGPATAGQGPRPTASAAIDPAALGLKLTSVAISAERRAAVISGRKYREGELVPIGGKDKASSGVEFRLTKVGFHEVELEYQGQTFTLELSRPRLAPGDSLNRSP
jgi:hypothetical protein